MAGCRRPPAGPPQARPVGCWDARSQNRIRQIAPPFRGFTKHPTEGDMANLRLNPYLTFKDNTRQAMDFYKSVFGGKLTSTSFKDGGMANNPAAANLVMHAMLEANNGITLMASDSPPGMGPEISAGNNISISLSGDDEKTLRGYWDKLSAGGKTTMPLEKAPWGDTFGMCTDKFGIQWLVNISVAQS